MNISLDYSLKTAEERNQYANDILTNLNSPSNAECEALADYILAALPKEERRSRSILTNNRLVTINRRETSFEGLCSKLEVGEDGIYSMLSTLGKQGFLTQKNPITEADLERIPALKDLQDSIQQVEAQYATSAGKQKQLLKKQLIQMRQDQYVLRNGFSKNQPCPSAANLHFTYTFYDSQYCLDKDGNPHTTGLIDLFNQSHIAAILSNYIGLKQCAEADFTGDLWFLMQDFDDLIAATFPKDSYLFDLLTLKTEGYTNEEIKAALASKHGISHTIEHISNLWRHKIPRLLQETAEKQFLEWYYTVVEYGKWKRCSCCHQVKLADARFFTRNSTSLDGFYSICKECRAKKRIAAKKVKK